MNRAILVLLGALPVVSSVLSANAAPSPENLLAVIEQVGKENAGQQDAHKAWAELAKLDARTLPVLIAGLDSANPLAANWIRSAIETIAERTRTAGGKLPLGELEAFLLDHSHDPRARRLAYELIVAADSTALDRLIPTMLEDPSLELRRDAVARMLDDAKNKLAADKNTAAVLFEQALKAARDEDQVKLASDKLKELGRSVDLPRHFGFIVAWKLIGPFDNVDEKGFPVAYPPEEEIDFAAEYAGKTTHVKWIDHATKDSYGNVDINAVLGKNLEAVAYAAAEFDSDKSRSIDLRIGTNKAHKIWLNGKLLHATPAYQGITKLDQFVIKGELQQGRNVILFKTCQNERTEGWSQDWKFQLRVCDAVGSAVLSSSRETAVAKEAAP
jgi:hypothetical protein